MWQSPEKPWGRVWLQTQNLKLGDGWEDSTHLEPGPHPTGARALYKADVTWGKPRGQEGAVWEIVCNHRQSRTIFFSGAV